MVSVDLRIFVLRQVVYIERLFRNQTKLSKSLNPIVSQSGTAVVQRKLGLDSLLQHWELPGSAVSWVLILLQAALELHLFPEHP